MMLACERSLERLGVDRLDLYLLHWESRHPMDEIIAGFEELVDEGLISRWGVSNLDIKAMTILEGLDGAEHCQTNQVLYNLGSRGVEFDLLPWAQEHNMPLMAYSPLGRGGAGGLLEHPALVEIADRHAVSTAQIALAVIVRQQGVIAIPKASSVAHVESNAAALDIELDGEDMTVLDRAFPTPTTAQPLDII